MLVALVSFRTEFRAHGDAGSLQQAVLFVPFYLVVVGVFASSRCSPSATTSLPDLTFGGMLETTYGGLIGLDGPYTFEHEVFRDFFATRCSSSGSSGC